MRKTKHANWTGGLALQFWTVVVACGLSFSALAQPSSADAAIAVAQQWLAVADIDPTGMWEQSSPLMKDKFDRAFWVNYITTRKNAVGQASSPRVWAEMERQIDHPSLPPGEFVSVLFVSKLAQIQTWEKVAMVWTRDRWVPVGYQYGTIPAAQPASKQMMTPSGQFPP